MIGEETGGAALTLRKSSPCEMFSASMKADTRWWMGPASPQCGRSTNVWKPLCLRDMKTASAPKPRLTRLPSPHPETVCAWGRRQGQILGC